MQSTLRTPPLTCSDEEVLEHFESIAAVPLEILPDDLSRSVLRLLVAAGRDVYAYASGGETTGTWCAWIGPLADVRPDHNGRVPLTEWVTSWRQLVDEMWPAMFAEPTTGPAQGGAA